MTAPPMLQNLAPVLESKAFRNTSVGPEDLDRPLGSGGLGLDSIAIAEMLIDLEHRTGLNALDLLETSPTLTLRDLAAHLERARS